MPAIITNKFRIHNAEMFEEEFGESSQQFYLGLGRISSWTDDTSPDTPTDTFNDIDIGHLWDDMIAAKEIPTTQIDNINFINVLESRDTLRYKLDDSEFIVKYSGNKPEDLDGFTDYSHLEILELINNPVFTLSLNNGVKL